MADEYSPQSPDLSGFFSGSPTTTNQPPIPLPAQTSSYVPHPPNISSFAKPYSLQQPQPQTQYSPGRNIGYPTTAYQQLPRQPQFQPQGYGGYGESFESFQSIPQGQGQAYPIPSLPPAHHNFAIDTKSQSITKGQQALYDYQSNIQLLPNEKIPQREPSFKSEPSFSPPYQALQSPTQYKPQSRIPQTDDMATRSKRERNVAVKSENGPGSTTTPAPSLGPSQGIEVRTKFPVARIKRIMQADEEVGKVAQVTPVAVSKALELFMISVVTKSAALAREGNSKRVSAQHLKKAIETDEQFDFLNDIVSKVVEGPEAGGKRVKDDDDSEDEEAKPKKARGRKKKE